MAKRSTDVAGEGHNSKETKTQRGGVAGHQLRSYMERIERLEEEKSIVTHDIKDVFAEAKSCGFDVATMRRVLRLRKMDRAKIAEQEALLDIYLHAIEGSVDDED